MNRRTFVSSLAVTGAALASGARLFGADSKSRPRVGVIGCGWFGGVNLESFARAAGVDFVSVCDVNQHFLKKTLATIAEYQSAVPVSYADYRVMLAATHHDIVIVATPDHWHALPAIAAMRAGADVYLEKPIGVDVIEGEAMVAAARKYGCVVQVNTQRRSNPLYSDARDKYITSGRLGKIAAVETYSYIHDRPKGFIPDAPVPAHLDYDFWTGPAPLSPFKAMKEDKDWRPWMAYGNGSIGNLGVHMVDQVRWILGLGWPESISSSGGILVDTDSSADISDTMRSEFRYPGLDLSWEYRAWGGSPIPTRHWSDQWGARFIGEKGTLNLTMLEVAFTPAGGGPREGVHMLSATGDLENVDLSRDHNIYDHVQDRHIMDFMHARETRGRPIADVEEGHISTACCVLANIALQLRRPVRYDPKSRTVPGDPEATRLLARPYRAPWVHPDPATV
ncbi:MAG TPA: Gfo/Idh/MocA family oxidoreductase [Opitutaceae bacterium]